MNSICTVASRCNVKLYIISSYRKPGSTVFGAIVQLATLSNHNVGHAIDMSVVYGKDGTICNSACLGGTNLSGDIKCFIDGVKQNGLRWGGNFSTKDLVHIDDILNLNDLARYKSLYTTIQQQC
ncbi:unnamed protein product [Rotaria sordida]|uniref:Peptidase M15C domain-containing protein n=1 Tax=Rotaria sordida TaxID=392033 RepID=A0A815HFU5_9BILA|nr:unnamed protein product [Rotaria sordida]